MNSIFRTVVEVPPSPFRLGYANNCLLLGSCFAQNMGEILQRLKFRALTNPFGVLFNPISVGMALKRIANGNPFEKTELAHQNEIWFSYMHNTEFSSPQQEECLTNINSSLKRGHNHWSNTEHLIVTFGTSRVYYHKELGVPVANCHKMPSAWFEQHLLSVREVFETWSNILDELLRLKPELKIIFSISPIRHWKDGAIGNQISKSVLLLAVRELTNAFPKSTFYFPSFEIMMDDLRDYRFYASDMLHPSATAVEYIWKSFAKACIDDNAISALADVEKIVQAMEHRVQRPGSPEHKKFIAQTLESINRLVGRNSHIDFSLEMEHLKSQLEK